MPAPMARLAELGFLKKSRHAEMPRARLMSALTLQAYSRGGSTV